MTKIKVLPDRGKTSLKLRKGIRLKKPIHCSCCSNVVIRSRKSSKATTKSLQKTRKSCRRAAKLAKPKKSTRFAQRIQRPRNFHRKPTIVIPQSSLSVASASKPILTKAIVAMPPQPKVYTFARMTAEECAYGAKIALRIQRQQYRRTSSILRFRTDWKEEDFSDIRRLASGGFGCVYRAYAKPLEDLVALKYIRRNKAVMSDEEVTLEYEVQKKISHKNLTRILGKFQLPHYNVWVLEFCCKGDLHDYLFDNGKSFVQTNSRSQLILKQVISATVFLHTKIGYIHMDLKPENVLLTSGNTAKVSDFGSAVKMGSCRQFHSFRESRGGTIAYRPPEMLQKSGFDSTADVWAIGCIAYQLLLIEHPFFLAEGSVPDQQNLSRALDRMQLMRAAKFRDDDYDQLSTQKTTFFRHIFGTPLAKRPLARDLENLAWINSLKNPPFAIAKAALDY